MKITSDTTIDDIVKQSLKLYDEIATSNLLDYEDMLRSGGASDEELEIELARVRADIAAERISYAATVRAQTIEADAYFKRGGRELQ